MDVNDPGSFTTVEEGNPLAFVITLRDRQNNKVRALSDIVFNYSVQGVTATLGADFTDPNNGTFTIPKGSDQFTLRFPTIDDNIIEQAETFRFLIRDAVGTNTPPNTGDNVGTGTILDTADNNAGTVITLQDRAGVEASGFVEFSVNLTQGSDRPVSVSYQTQDLTGAGAATAGADYTATTGRVTFLAGQTTPVTFRIPIIDDNLNEVDEKFSVRLFNPVNATFANNAAEIFATGTILGRRRGWRSHRGQSRHQHSGEHSG